MPTGGSLGGSFSNGARRYTDTPTTVIASERLDAYAGRNTVLAGAGMWSKTGKLRLDTGDLVFDNYQNKDTYVAVAGSVSAGVNRPWDGSFSAQYRNAQGLTFATLGAGDLNIRNRPRLDLTGLNRDVANMTRVTSSTSWAFALPALNLSKLSEDVKNSGRYLNALLAEVPQGYREQGEQGVKLFQRAMLSGLNSQQIRDYLVSEQFQSHLKARNSYQQLKKLTNDPEQLAFGMFFVMQGEQVYFDPEDGKLKVPVDCGQHGAFSAPCGKPVQDLARLIKDDPRGASAVVSDFLTKAVNEYAKLQGLEAQDKFDLIYACAASWALLSGNTQALDDLVRIAPQSRASYLAAYTSELKAMIAGNSGKPLSLEQVSDRLPNFLEANNGRAEDASWIYDWIPVGSGAVKYVLKQGARLLSTNAETGTVLVEAETAAVRVELNALVALGRATVDAAGNYRISVGDPAVSLIRGGSSQEGAPNKLQPSYTTAQLQHEFKHAGDFGIGGNWNRANGEAFKAAIDNHISNPGMLSFQGTYRGEPVTHYYDPATGNNVFVRTDGSFWGGWKLSQDQIRNVTMHGGLR